MPLSIDVVLVVYNRYDLTASCLQHLAAQTREHRVILVDNGSTDDTRRRLRHEWPHHTLLTLDQNQALSKACNLGISTGNADVVVWLNNDVDCRTDFLEQLVSPMETAPSVGSVASVMLQPGGQVIDSVGLTADPTLSGFPRLQWQSAERAGDPLPVLVGPAGTAAAYRRSAWEQVGGLDENIYAYYEDLDLALRLRAAGWQTSTAPTAAGIHLGSATHGHRSGPQRAYGGFARGYLMRRYRILRGRHAVRAALTEALVCAADLVISRDFAAARGRVRGWRAARGMPPRRRPPKEALDMSISFRRSITLRRSVYALPR
jgi:N-acetylglucosaminyl-diphospho-decaprenol L-rhamnosyltransferase